MASRQDVVDDLCSSFFLTMGCIDWTEDSDDHDTCNAFLLDYVALVLDLFDIYVGDQIAIDCDTSEGDNTISCDFTFETSLD